MSMVAITPSAPETGITPLSHYDTVTCIYRGHGHALASG